MTGRVAMGCPPQSRIFPSVSAAVPRLELSWSGMDCMSVPANRGVGRLMDGEEKRGDSPEEK